MLPTYIRHVIYITHIHIHKGSVMLFFSFAFMLTSYQTRIGNTVWMLVGKGFHENKIPTKSSIYFEFSIYKYRRMCTKNKKHTRLVFVKMSCCNGILNSCGNSRNFHLPSKHLLDFQILQKTIKFLRLVYFCIVTS